ncbi:MAG TPA: exonuclease SbcCD subunit D [Blastocatellia bacterium]|nr:exonuclease SbcCD subunit D [Blastocatellia bacterium]
MARFLHIADVHLGIKRYNLPDRTTDFFRSWSDVIEKYAIGRRVDFVLIAGDLFDQRKLDPQAANHAMIVLRRLEQEGIPVVAIEGNHDQREGVSRHSWLRSFSGWRYLKLLEPEWTAAAGIKLEPWDHARAAGAFIDIADARIFGSNWYGTTITQTLPILAAAIRDHRRDGATNILLLHSDIEGQLGRPTQSYLPLSRLVDLRGTVDYLALGHTHKRFEIDGWAFNPGSLEACNTEEALTTRGAYLVETRGANVEAEFLKAGRDFFQRPFKRLELVINGDDEPDAIRERILGLIRLECPASTGDPEDDKPIIEVTLKGQLGFKNSELRLDRVKDTAIERFNPLGLMITNKTVPRQLAVATDLAADLPRSERELRVLEDLLKSDSRFGSRAAEMAALIVEIKRLSLEKEAPDKILKLIEDRLFNQPAQPLEACEHDVPSAKPSAAGPDSGAGRMVKAARAVRARPPGTIVNSNRSFEEPPGLFDNSEFSTLVHAEASD